MKYLFYNQYHIDSLMQTYHTKTILLAEPELEARALYQKHLASPDVTVHICADLSQLLESLSAVQPDLLVINPGENPAHSLAFLKTIKKAQPALRIITIGYGTPEDYLDRYMKLGVSCHINRHLTRPQDVAVAAQQVLENVYLLNI